MFLSDNSTRSHTQIYNPTPLPNFILFTKIYTPNNKLLHIESKRVWLYSHDDSRVVNPKRLFWGTHFLKLENHFQSFQSSIPANFKATSRTQTLDLLTHIWIRRSFQASLIGHLLGHTPSWVAYWRSHIEKIPHNWYKI